jgi:hypothetical protein
MVMGSDKVKQTLILLGLCGVLGQCGGEQKARLGGVAPDVSLPGEDAEELSLEQEYQFITAAMGSDLSQLALCGELQTRLYAVYWQIFTDASGQFLDPADDLTKNESQMIEASYVAGDLLDQADRCGNALNNVLSQAGDNLNQSAVALEVPAVFKFLSRLVTFASDAENQLVESYSGLSQAGKEQFFAGVVKQHGSYQENIATFGQTSSQFEQNLLAGRLENQALALLKIANTGSVDPNDDYSQAFWDDAQANNTLPLDLSLKVGSELIRDGADVMIDVASGSALGKFGEGVAKAKDAIDKVEKVDSWFSQAYESVKSTFNSAVESFFDGGKRTADSNYTVQDYIDFEGNIAITENGAIQVKNYRDLTMNDLRAKVGFTNASEVDSIVLVHEFQDGRQAVQVITQAGGGQMPATRYMPSSNLLSDNATTVITTKKDPVTGEIKYASTSFLAAEQQQVNLTLPVPEVTQVEAGTDSATTGLTACQVQLASLSGQVCTDFSGKGQEDVAGAAQSMCDGYKQVPSEYANPSTVSSCATGAIKTCSGSLYDVYFYHSDSSEAQNITCDAQGQWTWGQ